MVGTSDTPESPQNTSLKRKLQKSYGTATASIVCVCVAVSVFVWLWFVCCVLLLFGVILFFCFGFLSGF